MAENRAPALVGSVLLHVGVLGAGLITLPLWSKPMQLTTAVPVTIVSHAPPEAPTATVQAPEPTPPTAPEPTPTPIPPTPAPPPPAPPTPAPPKPDAKPLDLAALAASLPQNKAQPNHTAKPVDLAALASSLPNSAARGPARPAAAPVVKPTPPRPLSGDEIGAVQGKLMRLWNPNCGAEGGNKVVVKVEFHLLPDGRLAGPPTLREKSLVDAGGPVAQAAAQRALTAVSRGEPYSELPKDRYPMWKDWGVTFDAKQACANQ